jgi:NAD(P)-dependent dehydrogenase (short-subunit alcohol dehydrogenase family)
MLKENPSLQDKVILITGSSRGIGREAALTLAAQGATIILHGRNIKALEDVYDRIVNQGSPEPAIFPLDLSTANPEQYQQLHDSIEQHFGKLDGLIHNASMLGDLTPIEYTDPRKWHEIMQVNLNAPYMLTQSCLPLLKQAAQASVVFTTSQFPEHAKAYWGAYGVAKQGCIALMQTLSEEFANQPLSFNAINPGPVRSPLRAQAYPAEDKKVLPGIKSIMPKYIELMCTDPKRKSGQIIQAQIAQDLTEAA